MFIADQNIIVDGIKRPTINNLGQPINSTIEGVESFWRWFGDSKTVDVEGRPMVLYHGTNQTYDEVNLNLGAQGIFWLTSNLEAIHSRNIGAQGFGVVMELYANIQSPATWKQYDNLLLDEFKGRGLDGAILPSKQGMHYEAFVMRPNQIKSINNSGLFNLESNSLSDKSPPKMSYKKPKHL